MSAYRCDGCPATFEHPDVEECETVDGHCALLVRAGWKPVWVRASLDDTGEQDRHIFTRGGWICPRCVSQYAPPRRPRKRRVRRRRFRDHDLELS